MNEEVLVSEKVKKIIQAVKKKTAMQAYKIELIKGEKPTLFDSKFGGIPYWDRTKDYPLDEKNDKMMLLAQINFTKEALKSDCLPEEGMLQFFISAKDDIYGMNFDEPTSQKNFRIVYHAQIDKTITEEDVRALEIPIATDGESEYSPLFQEMKVKCTPAIVAMGTHVYQFTELFRQVVKEEFGEDISDKNEYQYLAEEDCDALYEELDNTGHWLLGYPFFTQYDPRGESENEANYYDTLLFQMDSDGDETDYVLWGDCGVANFFINKEDLKKKDFSNVWYNWDCC